MLRRELSPIEHAELDADLIRYEEVNAELKALTEEKKAIHERIFSLLPDQPGEYLVALEGLPTFTATLGERMEWDQDVLQVLHESGASGAVEVRHVIDSRNYRKLPAEEQQVLKAALTRKPGQKKITIDRED